MCDALSAQMLERGGAFSHSRLVLGLGGQALQQFMQLLHNILIRVTPAAAMTPVPKAAMRVTQSHSRDTVAASVTTAPRDRLMAAMRSPRCSLVSTSE